MLLPARLSPRKGHLVLIEAAWLLTAAGLREVKFILAGEEQGRGAYVKEIDAAIAKAGLGGVVTRTGHCDDMPAALLAAAVVAVPSTEPEALGRVAAEAQAMGTPAVVSDIGALGDIIATPPDVELAARTGWRVPPGDARALARRALRCSDLGGERPRGLVAARPVPGTCPIFDHTDAGRNLGSLFRIDGSLIRCGKGNSATPFYLLLRAPH